MTIDMRIGTMRTTILRSAIVALSATALALAMPATSRAQQYVAGPRWLGWLGCWSPTPSDRQQESGAEATRIVCVMPTSDADVVEIAAIADGKIVSRDRIDASGRTQAIDTNGCRGTQSARWEGDGRRVYLKSQLTCEGMQTDMSAILAMTST